MVGRGQIVRGLEWCDKDFGIHPVGTEEPLKVLGQGIICTGPAFSLGKQLLKLQEFGIRWYKPDEGSGTQGEDEGIYSRDISDLELMGFSYQSIGQGGRKVFRVTHFLENR